MSEYKEALLQNCKDITNDISKIREVIEVNYLPYMTGSSNVECALKLYETIRTLLETQANIVMMIENNCKK